MYHLYKIQKITTKDIYKTVLYEAARIKDVYGDSDMLFPNDFLKNFVKSNKFSSSRHKYYSTTTKKYFARSVVLFQVIKYFKFDKLGSFISNMQAYFGLFGQTKKTEATAALVKLMAMDGADLLLISKLYSLNDFNILTEDPILSVYEQFQMCFEHMSNVYESSADQKYTKTSPCLNLNGSSICNDFCAWHNDFITNKFQKHELLILMR